MEGTLTCTLGSHAQHRTHYIQQRTTTYTKHFHNIQQQHPNYCEWFHHTIHKHVTHKANISNNRAIPKIQGYNITLTTTQVQEAIKQIKNNNSQGPDKLNIRHVKHIGPLGFAFLTSMLKTALNTNIILHIWNLANIVPIPKPQHRQGHLIHAHIPLNNCKDTEDEPSSLHNSKHIKHTHATRVQITNSTVTAPHTFYNTVAKGFNQMAPPARTITVALDMSKAFDTINIHTHIRKLLQIPGTIIKFKIH